MKNVQIPYELFVSLLRYHLMEEDDCLNEIRQGLEQKLDSLVRHELYGAVITKGFQSVDEFVRVANVVLNRRKSRAGKSLEHHLSAIFDGNGILLLPV